MGNLPISCCKSKSPEQETVGRNSSKSLQTSHSSKQKHGTSKLNQDPTHDLQQQNVLQHISEREPSDSETDPSSNAFNRPIFAARCSNAGWNKNTIYFSCYSEQEFPFGQDVCMSPDQGYNSNSTNLTQVGTQLRQSFNTYTQKLPSSSGSNTESSSEGGPSAKTKYFDISRARAETQESLYPSSSILRKCSSCSTIFANNSSITQPDLKQTIKSVALAIYYHVKNRTADNVLEIFDEHLHPFEMSPDVKFDYVENTEKIKLKEGDCPRFGEPDQTEIYRFLNALFKAARLSSEYAITTLVYMERLMTYAELDLTPKSWRRIFLGAILLSSKVWEDQAIWNVDYAQILNEIPVEDINELERQFLELIQFNMNVPSSVYAKYYFHLRTLAIKNRLCPRLTLLNIDEAKRLEIMSNVYSSCYRKALVQRKEDCPVKRCQSLEDTRSSGKSRAVIM